MPKSDQGVTQDRYMVIPRTLIFVTRGEQVLLLKGAPTKRLWANRYNGIGGHVERGEDVLCAARRELKEESNLEVAVLKYCGSIIVETGELIGICIFVFKGEYSKGEIQPSNEGSLEWHKMDEITSLPLVEDLTVILPRVLAMSPEGDPFSARSFYDEKEKLQLVFTE